MSTSILIAFALLLASARQQTISPEELVMTEKITETGGCIDLDRDLGPSKLTEAGFFLRLFEDRGILSWKDDQPQFNEAFQAKFGEAVPRLIAQVKTWRQHPFPDSIKQQWRRYGSKSSRSALSPDELNGINYVGEQLAKAAVQANNKLPYAAPKMPERLSDKLTLRKFAKICRYDFRISSVDYWQDWAFITTGITRGPLNGEEETWALRRKKGSWYIVAVALNNVS